MNLNTLVFAGTSISDNLPRRCIKRALGTWKYSEHQVISDPQVLLPQTFPPQNMLLILGEDRSPVAMTARVNTMSTPSSSVVLNQQWSIFQVFNTTCCSHRCRRCCFCSFLTPRHDPRASLFVVCCLACCPKSRHSLIPHCVFILVSSSSLFSNDRLSCRPFLLSCFLLGRSVHRLRHSPTPVSLALRAVSSVKSVNLEDGSYVR